MQYKKKSCIHYSVWTNMSNYWILVNIRLKIELLGHMTILDLFLSHIIPVCSMLSPHQWFFQPLTNTYYFLFYFFLFLITAILVSIKEYLGVSVCIPLTTYGVGIFLCAHIPSLEKCGLKSLSHF